MESLDLGSVFFEALEVPEYARPNFYIIKQKQSVWSKGGYLATLNEIYHASKTRLDFTYRTKKAKNQNLTIDDIKIAVKEFIGGENEKLIDNEILDKLHLAVQAAGYWDLEKDEFSAFQVLSLVEYALWFMRNEYRYIAGLVKNNGFRPRTKSYFNYLIAQDGPFFDFPRFKAAIRELNLTQQNRNAFKVTLEPFQKAAHEIVTLWNENIAPIVNNDAGISGQEPPELVMVEFKSADLTFSWWSDEKQFQVRPTKHYLAQDFAYYAVKISNLILNEILYEVQVEHPDENKNFLADLIQGIQLMQEEEVKVDLKGKGRHEDPYRNWIWHWFKKHGYQAERETLKGSGHIDLKVIHPSIGTKVIEFKGWWNDKKKDVIKQTCKYLTEFEDEAVIFIVNNTRKNIVDEYKAIVADPSIKLIGDFEEVQSIPNSDYRYYRTRHNFNGCEKTIYHFIFPG
jgi:hypothetical protein